MIRGEKRRGIPFIFAPVVISGSLCKYRRGEILFSVIIKPMLLSGSLLLSEPSF
jgi:hypothetical protein